MSDEYEKEQVNPAEKESDPIESVKPANIAAALNTETQTTESVEEKSTVSEETVETEAETISEVSEEAAEVIEGSAEEQKSDVFDDAVGRSLVELGLAEFVDGQLVIKKAPRKSKAPVIFLSVALFLALVFIGFQSVFIFRLSTGQLEKDSISSISAIKKVEKNNEEEEISTAIDPHFSLEAAAAVYDSNKKTLSIPEIYEQVYPSTVTIYVKGVDDDGVETVLGAGSGFFLTEDGYIVTNEHVVTDATGIEVVVPDYEERFDAVLVGKDVQTDIAVIKIDSDEKFKPVTLGDSSKLQKGELAVAIGSPLGSFEGSITAGIISGVDRPMNNNGYSMELIQTDTSVNSGNSGGVLVNSYGEVIGVVNAKIATAEGLGFAIPINSVTSIIESIIINGKVIDRPYLGVTVMYISDEAYFGAKEGVYCKEMVEDGPAYNSGMEIGDRIISMDGIEIMTTNDIILARDAHKCGEEMSVIVEREGQKVELILIIGDSADFDE